MDNNPKGHKRRSHGQAGSKEEKHVSHDPEVVIHEDKPLPDPPVETHPSSDDSKKKAIWQVICHSCGVANISTELFDKYDAVVQQLDELNVEHVKVKDELLEKAEEVAEKQDEIELLKETNVAIVSEYENTVTTLSEDSEHAKAELEVLRAEVDTLKDIAKKFSKLENDYHELLERFNKVRDRPSTVVVNRPPPKEKEVETLSRSDKVSLEVARAKLEAQIKKKYQEDLEREKLAMNSRVSQIQRSLSVREPLSAVLKKKHG